MFDLLLDLWLDFYFEKLCKKEVLIPLVIIALICGSVVDKINDETINLIISVIFGGSGLLSIFIIKDMIRDLF